jgi:para-nitrobenzyl esterase
MRSAHIGDKGKREDVMWRRYLVLMCGLGVTWGYLALAAGTDEIRVEGGVIAGTSANGVRAFKGIPFAAPPVGDLRWKPPQPVIPWSGVKSADATGPRCEQTPYPTTSVFYEPPETTSEDCLYLNVWTVAKAGDRRPVMVWIYGGALTRGSGAVPTYNGTQLAKKGVVVVTINYRLGAFGYLAHPALTAESPHHSSGNYGTLDQIAALRWVHNNIAAFGGDPGRIAIFGESAGSWSVNVLMATPLAKGLFHRAIGESGGRFARGITLAQAEQAGLTLARNLGAESLAALRAVAPDKILATTGFRTAENVDGWVLPDEVRSIFAQRNHNQVPIIVGSNSNESTTLGGANGLPKTMEEYRARIRTQYGDSAKEFDAAYPVKSEADIAGAILGSSRDTTFTWHMREWARMNTAGGAKAYLYQFTHVDPIPTKGLGAYHTAEIEYVFNTLWRDWPYTEVDRRVAEMISNYWVNFAATGDPNGSGLPKWPPYDARTETYMELGDAATVRHHLLSAQLDFIGRFLNRPQPAPTTGQ